jgi:tripeptidyl-peptidase-1
VSSWFEHHGVRSSSISTTHGGAWLTVAGVLVSQANDLLGASYQLYQHAKTNHTIIRTVGYAIPAVLHTHVQAVAPTTCFASTRVRRETLRRRSFVTAASQAEVESGRPVTVLSSRDTASGAINPSELHWLYKTFAYVPAATDKNALGVVGLVKDYPSQEDLTQFMTSFYSNAQAATFAVVPVNGGEENLNPTDEASLDVQYSSAMAYPTPNTFYSVGGGGEWSDEGEPLPGDVYHELLTFMLDLPKIPQTVSISYGFAENAFPEEYATAVCNLFAQLGVRGVSVLFPSGDDGVGPGNCVQFIPEFPSSCTSGVFPIFSDNYTN